MRVLGVGPESSARTASALSYPRPLLANLFTLLRRNSLHVCICVVRTFVCEEAGCSHFIYRGGVFL